MSGNRLISGRPTDSLRFEQKESRAGAPAELVHSMRQVVRRCYEWAVAHPDKAAEYRALAIELELSASALEGYCRSND